MRLGIKARHLLGIKWFLKLLVHIIYENGRGVGDENSEWGV